EAMANRLAKRVAAVKNRAGSYISGAGIAPVADFAQPFSARLFEQPHPMAHMLKFVDISPHLGPPGLIVGGGFSAGCATGMQAPIDPQAGGRRRKLDEDAADLLNLVVLPDNVLVTQEIAKTQFARFLLRFTPALEGSVLRP